MEATWYSQPETIIISGEAWERVSEKHLRTFYPAESKVLMPLFSYLQKFEKDGDGVGLYCHSENGRSGSAVRIAAYLDDLWFHEMVKGLRDRTYRRNGLGELSGSAPERLGYRDAFSYRVELSHPDLPGGIELFLGNEDTFFNLGILRTPQEWENRHNVDSQARKYLK